MNASVRVVVADDQNISRGFFEMFVRAANGYTLTAGLRTAREAAAYADGHEFDLLIMDVMMADGIDGLTAAEQIKREHPKIKIILTTSAVETTWEDKARAYILAAALLMLLYLTLRVFKYRIAEADAIPSRVAVYAYWIPQVMIPTLFLMTCIRIRRGERENDPHREMLLLIPAIALSLMVMTNDLHGLVYAPKVDLLEFAVKTGTYSLGLGFYLMYAWMGLTALAGFILLFRETRKRPVSMTVMLIVVLAAWVTLVLVCVLFFNKHKIPAMFNVPEVHIFCMLGVMEICIRERLIPYNENHSGFFSQLDLPVMIADKRFAPVYKSVVPIAASAEQLSASVNAPVYLNDDTRLSGI